MKLTKTATPKLTLTLLGPQRKRTPTSYEYRVLYRNPKPDEVGCVMVWDVSGGRLPYTIALERTDAQQLCWHCDCADAVYREKSCKHIEGLKEIMPVI